MKKMNKKCAKNLILMKMNKDDNNDLAWVRRCLVDG